jgi:septum formation protein
MLVLASTSRYRRELLSRLGLEFETFAPDIDETPMRDEAPAVTASRLAQAKARSAIARFPNALVLGSDQVAEVDGFRLDKPGNPQRAREQLLRASGRDVVFHTAVALLNTGTDDMQTALVPTRVRFRQLSLREIDVYLQREQPFDCAGSAKSEGLGVALLESINGTDPTALIGLPLIQVVSMLNAAGLPVL